MKTNTRSQLRALAEARRGVLVPGAFNALSARVIADLGFEALYITGAGVTNMALGLPDQGFMGLAEIAGHTARIRDAVDLPLIVDADTGFGNALNVRHTVRTLERAGADCIQLEDQVAPKRCGHFVGKEVIATEQAVNKIKAAVERAQKFAELGFGIVLYANAAFQGALAGMQKALSVLRETGRLEEDPALVAPFAERQRLVGKPAWDAMERRYTD
ncbi:MAG TPA: isocitrate lyase/PEP mutase family protein [Rhodoferax sp.]|nr:isocitrate lyase/PEP mutase family protein [Rhodoferax sp.]